MSALNQIPIGGPGTRYHFVMLRENARVRTTSYAAALELEAAGYRLVSMWGLMRGARKRPVPR